MHLRLIFYIHGVLLSFMSLAMVIPMLADFYFGYDDWKVFFACIIITAFFGGALMLSNAGRDYTIGIRDAFMLATSSWLVLACFAALPFWLSSLDMTVADAFFEAMSGITTTGATVITDLNHTPAGILFWRAMLQWLGGIGVIILAVSILPFLNVGGMQIFRAQSSTSEKALPRTTLLIINLFLVYLALTLFCSLAYMGAGLEIFDAVSHSMTTVSSGGFSNYDASFTHYNSIAVEWIAIVFMILSGLPFVLYLKEVSNIIPALLKDMQVRWFLGMIVTSSLVIAMYLYSVFGMDGFQALHYATFHVVSIITGTGFTNGDYSLWGGFCISVFFFIMVIGGCAGSTASGVKVFRLQILYAVAVVQLKKLIYPSGVFIPHYNRKPIPEEVPVSVMSFFFLYGFAFCVLAVLLSIADVDYITAISGAVSSISNVGPGIGSIIGPGGTYAPLPDAAKWLLSFGMLLGRLEIFTILVMFTPYFWKH